MFLCLSFVVVAHSGFVYVVLVDAKLSPKPLSVVWPG